MDLTVTIRPVKNHDDLYCHYSGQYKRQDCFVSLDLEDGELTADYNPEIGNGVPECVYSRRTLRWKMPLLTADNANWLLKQIKPLAQRVLAGATIELNRFSNFEGRLDADAEQASDEITRLCEQQMDSEAEVIEPEDWYMYDEPEITWCTRDAELKRIAREDRAAAISSSNAPGGVIIGSDFLPYLEELRRDAAESERL